MGMSRLFVIAGTIAVSLLMPLSAMAQQATKLAIVWGYAGDYLPLWVAKEKGLLEKHHLDATLTGLGNGAQAPSILESGSAQIAFTTPANLVLAVEGGLDQVVVAGAARLTKANPRTSLVTRTGITVAKPEDLVGKRIGTPGLNSTLDLNVKKWLMDHNVASNKVSFIETPFPQMGDMLKGNQIDAAMIVEPILSRVLASGAANRSVDILSENSPDQLGSIWIAKRDWATANKGAVAEFRAALAEAIDLIHKNSDEAKQIEAKYLNFAEPALPTFATEVKPADFAYWIAIARRVELLPQPVDATKIVFE
jgi:NitT/TauT family transport system substrate-binding protein